MTHIPFVKALHQLTPHAYAYLQPDGSWGLSNAGLVVDGSATLLVDTLFDLPLTREMLDTMRRAVPAAASIDTLVNTHADPDHTFGNQLVAHAEIIATSRAAEEMRSGETPAVMQELVTDAPRMGAAGAFILHAFARFDFSGIALVTPSRTFDGELRLMVGDVPVHIIEVGPAHTQGDTVVHLPGERVVFTGDIVFAGGHPVAWSGSVDGWIAACDRIIALDADVVVPGHGPVTDNAGVRVLRDYLRYVAGEATSGFLAGVPAVEAARRIDLSAYAGWNDPERIVVTVDAVYRERAGATAVPDRVALLAEMGRHRAARPRGGKPGS